MNDWTAICRVDDVPVLGARRVRRAAGTDVAVFRTENDRVFALLDRCPHKGGPLSQGIVFGEHVACPLHNWAISLVDGEARAPDIGCAIRFAVRVQDGVVSLLASELATLGIDAAALAGVDPATARRTTAMLSSDSRSSAPPDANAPSSSCANPPPTSGANAGPSADANAPSSACANPFPTSGANPPPSSCAKSQDPRAATIPIVSV